jgi:flagellar biosynthesis protein FliQ
MTPESVISVGQHALEVTVLLAAPLLLSALAIGLLVSMFQAATQINEVTLSFIPKLMILVVALMVSGSWMLRLIINYTRQLFESIPGLIG